MRSNCVKDMVGTDTNDQGELLRPFFTWSVYLDNNSSGFTVEGNVLSGNVNGGLFFHGGADNTVRNNVFARTSGFAPGASEPGDYGWYHAASVQYAKLSPLVHGGNNSVLRNVVLVTSNQSAWSLNAPFNASTPELAAVDRNLYYSSLQPLATMIADRTGYPPFAWAEAHGASNGTWTGWRTGLGLDTHSAIDVEPGFRDSAHGDFTLRPDSAAARLIGFEPIDPRILPC